VKSLHSWLGGAAVGTAVGWLFGFGRGDPALGVVLLVVYAVVGYGLLAFPEYRTRWSSGGSGFWYTVAGLLAPVAMFTPQFSPLLRDAGGLPLVALLGGLWLGGLYTGVALERGSRSGGDPDGRPDRTSAE
jgi:hypothetical protein